MAPPKESIDDRVVAARHIVKLFNPERYCFLILSFLTAAFVFYVAVQAYLSPTGNKTGTFMAFFGSGGIVAFNISRLLTMFNRVIDKVFLR
jgi:hypothetical protein